MPRSSRCRICSRSASGWLERTRVRARYPYGKALLDRDNPAGLEELHASEQLDTTRTRAYISEARWLAEKGRQDEALATARAGAAAGPDDNEAHSLLLTLSK